jgi:hypothetical protein
MNSVLDKIREFGIVKSSRIFFVLLVLDFIFFKLSDFVPGINPVVEDISMMVFALVLIILGLIILADRERVIWLSSFRRKVAPWIAFLMAAVIIIVLATGGSFQN